MNTHTNIEEATWLKVHGAYLANLCVTLFKGDVSSKAKCQERVCGGGISTIHTSIDDGEHIQWIWELITKLANMNQMELNEYDAQYT